MQEWILIAENGANQPDRAAPGLWIRLIVELVRFVEFVEELAEIEVLNGRCHCLVGREIEVLQQVGSVLVVSLFEGATMGRPPMLSQFSSDMRKQRSQ